MIWFWTAAIPVILGISIWAWPKDQRALKPVVLTGVILATLVGGAIYVTQWWPMERRINETVVYHKRYVDPPRVVYRDRVVYRQPGGEMNPVDVKAVCQGSAPVLITQIYAQASEENSDSTTWITGTLVGGRVKFTCGQPGDFTEMWREGDVVQFVRGTPQ